MKKGNQALIDHSRVSKEVSSFMGDRVQWLREMFPEIFSEGMVDLEKMRAALGSSDEKAERYAFTWAGKRNAIRILQMPTRATLIPIRDESMNFDKTRNLFVEGDNLEVLKLLYKPYFGKIKMIYIDPPFNTGNDFVYQDNYADPLDTYLRITGQKDAEGNLLTSNPETSGRFHSNWLSMMYPRLFLARQLLKDDGVILVSIDDHEIHNLRLIMNEIFGEENYLATFVWRRRASSALAEKLVSVDHEYVVSYHRGGFLRFRGREKDYANYSNPDNDPNGPWTLGDLTVGMTKEQRPNQFYDLIDPKTGKVYPANPSRVWAYYPPTMEKMIKSGRVVFPEDTSKRPMLKRYKRDLKTKRNPVSTWIKGIRERKGQDDLIELRSGLNIEGVKTQQELFGETIFNYPKPVSLIKSLIKYCTTGDDIILDFFAGSCTTAQAVLQLNREDGGNRRFIMAQLQEPLKSEKIIDGKAIKTVADIGKERIRRVIAKMKKGKTTKLNSPGQKTEEDLGFRVFKLSESNYKSWKGIEEKTAEKYAKEMREHIDPLVDGWKTEHVIYEVAIKEGFRLTSKIEPEKRYQKNEIWRIIDDEDERSLLICLDDDVKTSTIRSLEVKKDDIFVCRDIALDDTKIANLALQCNLKTI